MSNISRRQAIQTLASLAGAALIRPSSILSAEPIKDSIRFAVIGDWGTGGDDAKGIAKQMVQAHTRTPLDFVIAAGDNIYPNGSGRHFAKNFEQPFAPLISDRVNFYAVLGNHDVEDGRQDQLQYQLFNMRGRNYYTVKQADGLVELFMLDSTFFDNAQHAWVEQALSASTARWKVAVFHHPIYSSGDRHGSNPGLKSKLEPLFTKYKVNAVFSGHDHIYERTKPQQGIQYFVTGAGGKTRRGGVDLKSPIRQASYDADNHFMVVDIKPQHIEFQAVSETGLVVDSGIFGST